MPLACQGTYYCLFFCILRIGSAGTVERVIRNTREMEEKKIRFSKKKSKYTVIDTGRDKVKDVESQ